MSHEEEYKRKDILQRNAGASAIISMLSSYLFCLACGPWHPWTEVRCKKNMNPSQWQKVPPWATQSAKLSEYSPTLSEFWAASICPIPCNCPMSNDSKDPNNTIYSLLYNKINMCIYNAYKSRQLMPGKLSPTQVAIKVGSSRHRKACPFFWERERERPYWWIHVHLAARIFPHLSHW